MGHERLQRLLDTSANLYRTLNDVYENPDHLTVTISVTLQPITLSAPTFSSKTETYTGSPIAHTLGSYGTLTQDKDYTIASAATTDKAIGAVSATDAGSYALVVTGQGNYTLSEANTTFTISPRPVTITSADNSRAYDGTALTNGDKTVTVTGSGMVAGEEFDYDFTASQTDIGSTDNTFTVQETTTAKLANYTITPVYGKLTVTVPTNVAAPVEGIDEANVKQTDRETIKDTLDTVKDYLDMESSENEKEQLEALKEKLESLLEQIEDVQNALADSAISKVEDITADNAKPSDKNKLETAKEAIEDILDNYGGNLSEDEKAALNEALARIEAALKAIEQTEQARQQAAKTGDEAMPMLWLALALAATAALPLAAKKRR